MHVVFSRQRRDLLNYARFRGLGTGVSGQVILEEQANGNYLHETRFCVYTKELELYDLNSNIDAVLFCSVKLLSHVQFFVTPWTAALQASLSITISRSLLKFMSIESVMPSNHLILRCPLLLLPSIFPSIRVFSNESALCIRWPKYWSFSFNISPSSEYSGLISFRID